MPKKPSTEEPKESTKPSAMPYSQSLGGEAKLEKMLPGELQMLGQNAYRILADPTINLAFELLKDELINQWLLSENVEGRESLHLQTQLLEKVMYRLAAMVETAQTMEITEEQRVERDLQRYEDEQGFGQHSQPESNLQ